MSCTGPCNQGRRACPTPEACLREVDDAMETLGAIALGVVALVLLGVAALAMGALLWL